MIIVILPCYNFVRSHKAAMTFHNFCIWLFGGAKYQGRDEVEARGTVEQPLSDKPPLTRCGETYKLTTGRSSHWSCSVKKDVLKNFTNFSKLMFTHLAVAME